MAPLPLLAPALAKWKPAAGADRITTLETHAAGEPLRIVTSGLPEIPGATMLARRRWVSEHLDHVRKALMWEPRGHSDMYGAIVTSPVTPGATCGVLFMHNEGYSTMCGHGIIALVTALIESGAVPAAGARTPIDIDTPAGLVRATAHRDETGRVERVSFLNVASYLFARDLVVETESWGPVAVDVAFGGAYYALVPSERLGLEVNPQSASRLVAAGEEVKRAVNRALTITHPTDPDLAFLYGTILTGPPENPQHHSRNVCIFANAEVDRSPTGTGVSARIAQLVARGAVAMGERLVIESILGARSVFGVRAVAAGAREPPGVVVPEVDGTASVTGTADWVIDPEDSLGRGFLVQR